MDTFRGSGVGAEGGREEGREGGLGVEMEG